MQRPRKILVILLSLLLIISSLPAIPSFVNFVLPKSTASVPTNYWGKSPTPASSIDSVQVSSNPNSLGTTVAALAGLEDRNQPKIYYTSNAQDQSWLSYIKQTYAIVSTSRSIQYILQTYAPDWTISSHIRICEYAANDPEFPMQLDMCRTVAGVQNTLVVDSNDLAQVLTWLPTAFVYINVNSNSCNAGPDPRLLCFNWLWTNTKNATTRTVFSIPNNGRQQSSDYYVEEKMFEFEFTCAPGKTNCLSNLNGTGSGCTISTCENTFANFILNQFTTPNTPAMGFFGLGGEVGTISLLSSHQEEMTANEEFSNLGFMSGFPNLIGLNQQPAPFISFNPSKVYVMFQITQGDALFYDGYYNMATWNATDPSNGLYYRTEFSSDWQINPMLAQLAPPIIKYYYQTQNFLVDFSTGPSAGGYTHPDLLPNEGSFGALASQWATNVGIGEHFIITSSKTTLTLQNYATAAHPSDILLWFQNHNPQNQILNANNVSAMFASFWTPSIQSFSGTDVANEIAQIKASAVGTNFVYVIMNAQNPGLPFIKQVLAGLPSNYVDVRADQYSCLYRQSQGLECAAGNPTPPNYQVSLNTNTTTRALRGVVNISAYSNLDVGGTPYSINIYDFANHTSFASCSFGTSCSVLVHSNTAITIQFQANIGTSPTVSVQATSMIKLVSWSSSPPPANYPLGTRAIRIRALSNNSAWALTNPPNPATYNAQQVITMISQLQPDTLERFIDGYQNASKTVPGSPSLSVGVFLNDSMAACSPACIIIPRLSLDDWKNNPTDFYAEAHSLITLPVSPAITFLSLDNWHAFACSGLSGCDNNSISTINGVFNTLYAQGWAGIGVNDAGGYFSSFGQATFADINTALNVPSHSGMANTAQLNGVLSEPNIRQVYLYIDFPQTMNNFIANYTVNQQEAVIVNLTQHENGRYEFFNPIAQGAWDANLRTMSNGTTLFTIMQNLLAADTPVPAVCPIGSAVQVCLTADGTQSVTVNTGTSVLLMATVYNLPANQTTYSIYIIDQSNSTTIALCPSGVTCSVAVTSNIGFTDSYDAKLVHN